MKKLFFCLIVLGTILTSCSEEVLVVEVNDNPPVMNTKSAGDGKYDLLGYGYDITGEYLSVGSSKFNVVDVEKLVLFEKGKQPIDSIISTAETTDFYYGGDALDYIKEINKKVVSKNGGNSSSPLSALGGKLLGFSATVNIETQDSSRYTISSKNSYARSETIIKVRGLKINRLPRELYPYLSESFKTHIQSYSPRELINAYGTHVLTDIFIGGRLYSNFQSTYVKSDNYSMKRTHVQAGLKVSLLKIGLNTDTDVNITNIESTNKNNIKQSLHVRAEGGTEPINETYDFIEATTPTKLETNLWKKSVYENKGKHGVIVDVNWDRAYPIYEFIEDGAKREAVKKELIKYIESKQFELLNIFPMYQYSMNAVNFYYDTKDNGNQWGWTKTGIAYFIHKEQVPGSVPLYQYSMNAVNFYYDTKDNGNQWGWTKTGIVGYVFKKQMPGTVPLYQYSMNAVNFYYDTKDNGNQWGWTKTGVVAYVYPIE